MTVIRRWRIALVVLGLALILLGAAVLLADVAPSNYTGILVWLIGAIIIHDGIIAPATFGVNVLMRRAGKKIPLAVLMFIQGAIVVGAIMALIVFPEIIKKSIGTANPTMLPLDYATNLAVFYLVLIVATAGAVTLYLTVFAKRQKVRPSSSQS